MKLQLPEYLLCEDPTTEAENLFVYHTVTKSLVKIIHTDAISKEDAEKIRHIKRRHFDYTYKNAVGKTEQIVFIAGIIDGDGITGSTEQRMLEDAAHWYACYLGWERDCDDVLKKKTV